MEKPATTSAATAVALALLLSLLSPPTARAATFNCSGRDGSTCTSLLGFPVANASTTTYRTIASLFNVSVGALLAANGRTAAAAASRPVARPTVTVPIPCTCAGGVGTSGNTTRYTIGENDGLDFISRTIFGGLVTYQEVAKANGIPNPDLIIAGNILSIPLPCSCDQVVPEEAVVHYAYKVAEDDDLAGIANRTGATTATIQRVNGIADPTELMAEQILDVPLRTCGPSPSPLLDGTNFTSGEPCPAGSAAPGPSPRASNPAPNSPAGSVAPGPSPRASNPDPSSPAGSVALGPSSRTSNPVPRSPAARAIPGLFGWTTILVLSQVLLLVISSPRV